MLKLNQTQCFPIVNSTTCTNYIFNQRTCALMLWIKTMTLFIFNVCIIHTGQSTFHFHFNSIALVESWAYIFFKENPIYPNLYQEPRTNPIYNNIFILLELPQYVSSFCPIFISINLNTCLPSSHSTSIVLN